MILKRILLITFTAVSLIAGAKDSALAATTFTGTLNSAQEVPTNSSPAVGFGRVTLNDAETQITVSLNFSGLSSNQIASHIHGPALPGANAPIIFNIGSTGMTSGTFQNLTFAVTSTQVANLKNGLWYFNVHSSNFPGGEIRGQIFPDSPFVGTLNGKQEVPANASDGTGFGRVSLNATETQIVVSLSFVNLSSNQIASHIHGSAIPGVNAPILFNIGATNATSGSFTDLFFNVTPAQVADLKAGRFYFNVHSANLPGGEIRGQIKSLNKSADFTGDSRADISVFRPSNGIWYKLDSENALFSSTQFGASSDVLAPADYDADGKTDFAVWRGSTGTWFVLRSSDNTFIAQQFGASGDIPVPADYDRDGRSDVAVWRPSNSTWFVSQSGKNNAFLAQQFGSNADLPVAGDYDGDRQADFAVFRPSSGTWFVLGSSAGFASQQWGTAGDKLVPADYDADGKTDFAVWRPSNGIWYVLQSTSGFVGQQWGVLADVPTPADYDGDGRADFAVWRPDDSTWYLQRSALGYTSIQFGASGDVPVPAAYVR